MSTYTQTQTTTISNPTNRRPIVFVALLLIAAAVIWQVVSHNSSNVNTLSTNVSVWEGQNVDSYSYDLQVSCFCFPDMTRPVRVIVSDGVVESVTYIDDGTAADPDLFASYSTVEALFERLEMAQSQNPVTFDVTYDAQYGVPQSVAIDIDEMMADEEIYFSVSNFDALP